MPTTMTAVAFDDFGGPQVLQARSMPTPVPGSGEVLIRVGAVSVGRLLDLGSRAGIHPYTGFRLPHVLGAEHAGTVVAVGPGVTEPAVGDHVAVFPVIMCGGCTACLDGHPTGCAQVELIGVHRPGAYAQYSLAPAGNTQIVPDPLGIGPAEAAALALAGPVAMNQLTQAGVKPGDWVLVQGASSALGSLTVALAQHVGARVIATSRSPQKRAMLLELGVTAALDPTADDFVEQVLDLTGGQGVPVAVDDLGEPSIWRATMASLATLGTVVSSGAFLGGTVELDLNRLYLRSQRVLGIRTGTPASVQALWQIVGQGFRPVIDRSFPLERAAEAHEFLQDSSNFGRVVLTTSDLVAAEPGAATRSADPPAEAPNSSDHVGAGTVGSTSSETSQ